MSCKAPEHPSWVSCSWRPQGTPSSGSTWTHSTPRVLSPAAHGWSCRPWRVQGVLLLLKGTGRGEGELPQRPGSLNPRELSPGLAPLPASSVPPPPSNPALREGHGQPEGQMDQENGRPWTGCGLSVFQEGRLTSVSWWISTCPRLHPASLLPQGGDAGGGGARATCHASEKMGGWAPLPPSPGQDLSDL